jgi:hypothetical protein
MSSQKTIQRRFSSERINIPLKRWRVLLLPEADWGRSGPTAALTRQPKRREEGIADC